MVSGILGFCVAAVKVLAGMSDNPADIRMLADDEYLKRMAIAIHNVSSRRNVHLIQGWRTLSEETQTFFLELATTVVSVLDGRRSSHGGRL